MNAAPEVGFPPDATHDRLIGDVSIYQRRGGHRSGTDDVLTAYFACVRCDDVPDETLDLGCGVGSALLFVAHRLRPARAVGVEAQDQSVALLRRALDELPLGFPAVELHHADFRSLSLGRRFRLITGTPPYFPFGTGVLPDDGQRRACRFEERGGVEAYCDAASRHLAEDGAFYVVHQTRATDRVLAAAAAAGLHLAAQLDAFMRADRPEPFLSVYELRSRPAPEVTRESFAIRAEDGEFSNAYRAARRELGVD